MVREKSESQRKYKLKFERRIEMENIKKLVNTKSSHNYLVMIFIIRREELQEIFNITQEMKPKNNKKITKTQMKKL